MLERLMVKGFVVDKVCLPGMQADGLNGPDQVSRLRFEKVSGKS